MNISTQKSQVDLTSPPLRGPHLLQLVSSWLISPMPDQGTATPKNWDRVNCRSKHPVATCDKIGKYPRILSQHQHLGCSLCITCLRSLSNIGELKIYIYLPITLSCVPGPNTLMYV